MSIEHVIRLYVSHTLNLMTLTAVSMSVTKTRMKISMVCDVTALIIVISDTIKVCMNH